MFEPGFIQESQDLFLFLTGCLNIANVLKRPLSMYICRYYSASYDLSTAVIAPLVHGQPRRDRWNSRFSAHLPKVGGYQPTKLFVSRDTA
jgi:hypothetical protein